MNDINSRKIEDPLKGLTLYDWQNELKSILSGNIDDRIIYWYWEPIGCTGKTMFIKSWCIHHRSNSICLSGENDIKTDISTYIQKHKNLRTIFFDYSRYYENSVPYDDLEAIKDGLFYSEQYERTCIYNVPHVIVFANFPPDENICSNDKWVVKRISID
jgi:hypothetical protein